MREEFTVYRVHFDPVDGTPAIIGRNALRTSAQIRIIADEGPFFPNWFSANYDDDGNPDESNMHAQGFARTKVQAIELALAGLNVKIDELVEVSAQAANAVTRCHDSMDELQGMLAHLDPLGREVTK